MWMLVSSNQLKLIFLIKMLFRLIGGLKNNSSLEMGNSIDKHSIKNIFMRLIVWKT